MNTARAVPELSVDTQTLEKRLRATTIDDVVPYAELSALIGRDVQNGARHLLQSARRRLLTQEQLVFGVVTDVGLKRLSDVGIVGTSAQHLRHIHRTATRAARELASVREFDKLPNEAKVRHNASVSVCGVLRHVTKQRTLLKLEGAVETANAKLPLAEMLEAVRTNL